jgi:hypothetical protein
MFSREFSTSFTVLKSGIGIRLTPPKLKIDVNICINRFFADYRKNGCLADNWDQDLEQTIYHLCRPIIILSG